MINTSDAVAACSHDGHGMVGRSLARRAPDGNPDAHDPRGGETRGSFVVVGGSDDEVAALPPGYFASGSVTTMAVTMPIRPVSLSAWLRMWQWNAHVPTSDALISTVYRSPGDTHSVST